MINTSIAATTVRHPVRYSSFRASEKVGDLNAHPQVDIVKNPVEWQFVERILARPLVAEPSLKSEYPSGWKPPGAIIDKTKPYYVPRTKNHMIPVYLHLTYRGARHVTKLRRVQGNIWRLEEELRTMIEQRLAKKIATRINEMSAQIWFKGDYVTLIRDYLMKKGF